MVCPDWKLEYEALLDGIRFPWNPHDETWEEMFEKLRESISTGSSPEKRLLSWMRNQRTEFVNGRLSEERVRRLNEIGFCWDQRYELWRKRFEQLREYHREHGECLGHKAEKPLRSWIGIQRREYWRTVLSQGKIDLLNGIGFPWDPTGKRSVIPSADDEEWEIKTGDRSNIRGRVCRYAVLRIRRRECTG